MTVGPSAEIAGSAPEARRPPVPGSVATGLDAGHGSRWPIEAQGLVRRYGSKTAVDGVDLQVGAGEIFGFLGANGAGKTTCVRMLVTLLRPTSGWARVAGFDVVESRDDVRRAIGVALQEVAIDPFMTGRELMRLQGALHGLDKSRSEKRGGELLERVGLSAVASNRVSTYSGGMQRRLDLAMALLHEPQVLFLDEPTAGLDPTSRQSLWEEVRALNAEQGMTVFLTTHYLEEADRLAGRVAILDQGKIVKQGAPEQLKAEVGAPALSVVVADGREAEARAVLERFGSPLGGPSRRIAVRLPGGAAEMARVVRELDAAGIAPESMELTAASLDDVFAAATGQSLKAADGEPEGGSGEVPADA